MSNVAQNLKKVLADLPEGVRLVAVSKFHPVEMLREAYDAGQRIFGESHVQELMQKVEQMPKDVEWHFIGHLQTNKVRQIIDKVVMIHSVDSLKLAREIDKRAAAAGITMDVLIEINSAMEETKSGIPAADLRQLVTDICAECGNVRVCGIMCIPPIAAEPEDSRPYFREAAELFEDMKGWDLPAERFAPTELSMGMSGDFEVAVEEGATMVRVGSSIFGPRNYR